MAFNESTRLSLEKNYDHITNMQKDCDARFKKQQEFNHSIYERRERVKVEVRKGQSKRVGPKVARGPDVGLFSPSSSP